VNYDEKHLTGKNNFLSCSFYLYRFRKYVSYGFPIINFCNPGVHYETPYIYIYIYIYIYAYGIYKTWRFSHDLDLLSFIHILFKISRAMFKDKDVLEPWSRKLFEFLPPLLPRRNCRFLSRLSRSRICFSIPTSSSSTLCWIPLDVSMNLQSRDAARAFPSEKN